MDGQAVTTWRRDYEAAAAKAQDGARIEALARAVRGGSAGRDDCIALAAAFAHCAFAAPERIALCWDAAARGWFDTPDEGAPIALVPAPAASPPATLWADFWALVDAATDPVGGGIGALGVTERTAALGAHLSSDFAPRAAAACLGYPGIADAAAHGLPGRFTLAALAACPPGSLGHDFHRQIIDNGFDLEVLDRDALGLAALPSPLGYVNARILQLHDLLHLTGDYHLTSLHEIAISGFQMGQFGHGYSAMFLAFVVTTAAASPAPGGLELMLDVILRGWRHGRRSPPLLGAHWEAVWDLPVAAVRERLGVARYDAPYPPDLLESLARAA